MTSKIVVPDKAIYEWNARYYPEANEPKPTNRHCQDCGDLISEDGFPYPFSCSICLDGRIANDEYDEGRQMEIDKGIA